MKKVTLTLSNDLFKRLEFRAFECSTSIEEYLKDELGECFHCIECNTLQLGEPVTLMDENICGRCYTLMKQGE